MIDRQYFKDGAFLVNCKSVTSNDSLLTLLKETFSSDVTNLDELTEFLKNKDVLVYFDCCNEMIESHRDEFEDLITNLINQTT